MSAAQPGWLLCTRCAELHRPAEFCPVHPDEPLLDPSDEQVVYELIALDDRSRSRTYMFWGILMGGVGFALGIASVLLLGSVSEVVVEAYRLELVAGATAGFGVLGLLIAKIRFRQRFTQWTEQADGGSA